MYAQPRRIHPLRRVFVWMLRVVTAIGVIVLALAAWIWLAVPFNSDFPVRATPLEAASTWFSVRDANGVPIGKPDPQARVLAQQYVGLGRIALLYRYRQSLVPGATTIITPVTVAPESRGFLRREQGWRPQAVVPSSSPRSPQVSSIMAATRRHGAQTGEVRRHASHGRTVRWQRHHCTTVHSSRCARTRNIPATSANARTIHASSSSRSNCSTRAAQWSKPEHSCRLPDAVRQ